MSQIFLTFHHLKRTYVRLLNVSLSLATAAANIEGYGAVVSCVDVVAVAHG